VRGENLTYVGLVGLPLAVAVCLGLFVRSLGGWGSRWWSRWWVWLWAAVVLGANWLFLVSGAP
jgi:hypothetical protein